MRLKDVNRSFIKSTNFARKSPTTTKEDESRTKV